MAGPITLDLQLFELTPHLVDGLVELLHSILKRGVLARVGPLLRYGFAVGERSGGGAVEGELRLSGALQQALELAAPFGLPQ
jgi:hypothetical protein